MKTVPVCRVERVSLQVRKASPQEEREGCIAAESAYTGAQTQRGVGRRGGSSVLLTLWLARDERTFSPLADLSAPQGEKHFSQSPSWNEIGKAV